MRSRADPVVVGSVRRKATVTISAPDATSARSMASRERKPPVPTISREPQVRPPSSNPSEAAGACSLLSAVSCLATLHRPDHLDSLPLAQRHLSPIRLSNHLAVDGHRDPAYRAIDPRFMHRVGDRGAVRKLDLV